MGFIETLTRCLGIVGVFVLPLIAISVFYYVFTTLSGMHDLGSFMTGFFKSVTSGTSHAYAYY